GTTGASSTSMHHTLGRAEIDGSAGLYGQPGTLGSSSMLDARALGMLSAALRHVRTAELLASIDSAECSPDQAFHLAGFWAEYGRKAGIPQSTYGQAIGHGVGEASELALRFALAADPVARRYDVENWAVRYPVLATWSERVRYETTGRRSAKD